MPALPFVTGLVRLLLQYVLPAVPLIINRLFFQGTGSTTNSALNTYCSNVATAWNADMASNTIPDCQLVAVTAEDLTSATSPIGAWSGNHPGGETPGVSSYPNAAFIVKNHTNLRARGGHSRTYLPGIATNQQSSNGAATWNPTSATAILNAWQTFLAAITGSNGPTGYSGFAQVMPNYYHGFKSVQNPITGRYRNVPVPLATPNVYPVTATSYNTNVGSQRRRNKQSS